MRLLELFSGSKSVSNAIGHLFSEIVSLDIVPEYSPTITTDILEWDYRQYPPNHFHTIWASPPCTEFSALNYARPDKIPNLTLANRIVQRTLEIIAYFNPVQWFMENPQTGTLKNQLYMNDIPFADFDYCTFGFPYRKRTRIWSNMIMDSRLCKGAGHCENMEGRKHKSAIGNHSHAREYWQRGTPRILQRYAIPAPLIEHLFSVEESE